MTRDEERGQYALVRLSQYVKPTLYFVSGDGKAGEKLYDLERQRNDLISACARQWALIAKVDREQFWTRSLPQALHDALETFDAPCSILAAEAFLERHGWTVTRPAVVKEVVDG